MEEVSTLNRKKFIEGFGLAFGRHGARRFRMAHLCERRGHGDVETGAPMIS